MRFYVALSHTGLGFVVFLVTGALLPLMRASLWLCAAGFFHLGCAGNDGDTVFAFAGGHAKYYATNRQKGLLWSLHE